MIFIGIKSTRLALLIGLSIGTANCGKRSPYEISDPSSASRVKKGTTNCSKNACEKLKLVLDVTVPTPGIYSEGSRTITVPSASSTQIRFTAKTDAGITRHMGLLVMPSPQPPAWLTQDDLSSGSLTLKAAPPANSPGGSISLKIRDITYCAATSKNPDNCRTTSEVVDSDETITFTIAPAAPGMQSNGVYVLPSESLCVKPPSQLEQTISGLQQGVNMATSIVTGNFISVITNVTSNVVTSQQANQSGQREGC